MFMEVVPISCSVQCQERSMQLAQINKYIIIVVVVDDFLPLLLCVFIINLCVNHPQGQCGCSGTDDSNQFLKNATLVESLPTCKQVACGYEYSMFLTLNGEVYGTGECNVFSLS